MAGAALKAERPVPTREQIHDHGGGRFLRPFRRDDAGASAARLEQLLQRLPEVAVQGNDATRPTLARFVPQVDRGAQVALCIILVE